MNHATKPEPGIIGYLLILAIFVTFAGSAILNAV